MVRRHRGARRDRLARPRRLGALAGAAAIGYRAGCFDGAPDAARRAQEDTMIRRLISLLFLAWVLGFAWFALLPPMPAPTQQKRSEEHTSELQSLMRISYAVFCLKKKNEIKPQTRSSQY